MTTPPPVIVADYQTLVEVLAEFRRIQGLPVGQLAEALGIMRNNVGRTLSGRHELRGPRLFALAHALGYDLALVPMSGASARRAEHQARLASGETT